MAHLMHLVLLNKKNFLVFLLDKFFKGPPPRPPPPPSTITNEQNKKQKIIQINQFILNLFENENPFTLKNNLKKSEAAESVSTIDDTNSHYNTDTDDDSDYSEEFDDSNSASLSDTSSASSIKIVNTKRGGGGTTDSIKTSSVINQMFNNIPNKMKTPIVTNTTLNVIRLFGKYLHMLDTFEIISTDVINYMMQLFNFYFYYIYFNFAKREVN